MLGIQLRYRKKKRAGSEPARGRRQKSRRRQEEPKQAIEDEPKERIDDDTLEQIKKARMLRGIISHPEYADEDDGLDALMNEGTLYYAIQGRVSWARRSYRGISG